MFFFLARIYFISYWYIHSCFVKICECIIYLLPSFHFKTTYVVILQVSLLQTTYIWVYIIFSHCTNLYVFTIIFRSFIFKVIFIVVGFKPCFLFIFCLFRFSLFFIPLFPVCYLNILWSLFLFLYNIFESITVQFSFLFCVLSIYIL